MAEPTPLPVTIAGETSCGACDGDPDHITHHDLLHAPYWPTVPTQTPDIVVQTDEASGDNAAFLTFNASGDTLTEFVEGGASKQGIWPMKLHMVDYAEDRHQGTILRLDFIAQPDLTQTMLRNGIMVTGFAPMDNGGENSCIHAIATGANPAATFYHLPAYRAAGLPDYSTSPVGNSWGAIEAGTGGMGPCVSLYAGSHGSLVPANCLWLQVRNPTSRGMLISSTPWDGSPPDYASGNSAIAIGNIALNQDDHDDDLRLNIRMDGSIATKASVAFVQQDEPTVFPGSIKYYDVYRPAGAGSLVITKGDYEAGLAFPGSNSVALNAVDLWFFHPSGDFEINAAGAGSVMRTPDGTKIYRVSVNNAGAVVSTLVP